MSEADDNATKKPLVVNKAKFARSKAHKSDPKAMKLAVDKRNRAKNTKGHMGIRSLKVFNCPVCACQGSVRVTFDPRRKKAIVECSYCMNLKPRPAELPYPYAADYTSRALQNRADVFFRFQTEYLKLVKEHRAGAERPERGAGAVAEITDKDRAAVDRLLASSSSDDDDDDGNDNSNNGDVNRNDGGKGGSGSEDGEPQPQAPSHGNDEEEDEGEGNGSGGRGDEGEENTGEIDDAIDFFNDDD